MSASQLGAESLDNMALFPINISHQLLAEDVPKLHKRGIPKPTYEHEISSKVKYPMSYYIS